MSMAYGPPRLRGFWERFYEETVRHEVYPNLQVWKEKVIFTMRSDLYVVYLDGIQARTQKQGDGTRALTWLLDLADEFNVVIKGTAEPFGMGMEKTPLKAWYRKHGFKVSRNGDLKYLPLARKERPPGLKAWHSAVDHGDPEAAHVLAWAKDATAAKAVVFRLSPWHYEDYLDIKVRRAPIYDGLNGEIEGVLHDNNELPPGYPGFYAEELGYEGDEDFDPWDLI